MCASYSFLYELQKCKTLHRTILGSGITTLARLSYYDTLTVMSKGQ